MHVTFHTYFLPLNKHSFVDFLSVIDIWAPLGLWLNEVVAPFRNGGGRAGWNSTH